MNTRDMEDDAALGDRECLTALKQAGGGERNAVWLEMAEVACNGKCE